MNIQQMQLVNSEAIGKVYDHLNAQFKENTVWGLIKSTSNTPFWEGDTTWKKIQSAAIWVSKSELCFQCDNFSNILAIAFLSLGVISVKLTLLPIFNVLNTLFSVLGAFFTFTTAAFTIGGGIDSLKKSGQWLSTLRKLVCGCCYLVAGAILVSGLIFVGINPIFLSVVLGIAAIFSLYDVTVQIIKRFDKSSVQNIIKKEIKKLKEINDKGVINIANKINEFTENIFDNLKLSAIYNYDGKNVDNPFGEFAEVEVDGKKISTVTEENVAEYKFAYLAVKLEPIGMRAALEILNILKTDYANYNFLEKDIKKLERGIFIKDLTLICRAIQQILAIIGLGFGLIPTLEMYALPASAAGAAFAVPVDLTSPFDRNVNVNITPYSEQLVVELKEKLEQDLNDLEADVKMQILHREDAQMSLQNLKDYLDEQLGSLNDNKYKLLDSQDTLDALKLDLTSRIKELDSKIEIEIEIEIEKLKYEQFEKKIMNEVINKVLPTTDTTDNDWLSKHGANFIPHFIKN